MRTPAFLLMLMLCISCSCNGQARDPAPSRTYRIPPPHHTNVMTAIVSEAEQYVDSAGMDHRYCILLDVGRPSSQNRLIVYDFWKDSVVAEGKAAHGRCNLVWLAGKKYSNAVGSGCTALGRYRVGNRYTGRFGLAYKLYGLDPSNNNAYKRFIVLHGHECIPPASAKVLQICQSDGCPMVAPDMMKTLDGFLQNSRSPVLLWIYDSTEY